MNARRLLLATVLCCLSAVAVTVAAGPELVETDDDALHAWRAVRRAAVRERCLAAGKVLSDPRTAPARFGLLVIPVDFSDHRLPDAWDSATLAPRLTAPDGQSLRHYFTAASAGRCELVAVTAPLVKLPGSAADYSDIGFNGFTRSRRLAAEALTAVAAAGFDWRLADLDGPDGRPGTVDDDGWIDGVLILHAEAGQENDPGEGLIQALQYFLDPPLSVEGITAGPYAVASLASGPGIWAHETAHLMGMEDRYDPLLPPADGAGGLAGAGDLAGAGGLGVFSLMAAGARGTGGGWNPSLPDAYSRALLGWCEVAVIETSPAAGDSLRAAPAGNAVHRVWTRGEAGPEFFLLEARDPAAAAPFDGAVPAAGLMVLHIDESVPEGGWADDGFQDWHLRARLVEADGGAELRAGLDTGGPGDVFPGSSGTTSLTPATTPASDGYAGPSGVSVTGIALTGAGVVHRTLSEQTPWLSFEVTFTEGPVHELRLEAEVHGGVISTLTVGVEAVGNPVWGDFGGGALTTTVVLQAETDGLWRPVTPTYWYSPVDLPPDAFTTFRYTLTGPGTATLIDTRPWTWSQTSLTLDFANSWPGDWVVEQPDGPGTSWRRWTGTDSPAFGQSAVLVCTGDIADPAAWPDVTYTNGGRARLTSGPLADETAGVRLLHWVDVETLADGAPMDGAVVSWVGPEGAEVPAAPVHGWPARVDATSGSVLRGRGSFGGAPGELTADDQPVWRTDLFPVPTAGTGPWRLRLEFAANDLWRARGWVVGRCEALTAPLDRFDENLRWAADLDWDWTWAGESVQARCDVQARSLPGSTWITLLTDVLAPVPGEVITPLLSGPAGRRHEVRVTGPTLWGTLALSPVTVYADGGAVETGSLGEPWPNPAAGSLRFTLQVPDGATARLRIYDLRGRLVHERDVPPGLLFSQWDGRDEDGRRLPSGTYVLKLEGAGAPTARKVVLRH